MQHSTQLETAAYDLPERVRRPRRRLEGAVENQAMPLIVVGALQATVGLAQAADGASVHGTYPNKNNFAALLEMVLPVTVGVALPLP